MAARPLLPESRSEVPSGRNRGTSSPGRGRYRRLFGAAGGIDERVDGRRGEDEASCEEADDLHAVSVSVRVVCEEANVGTVVPRSRMSAPTHSRW